MPLLLFVHFLVLTTYRITKLSNYGGYITSAVKVLTTYRITKLSNKNAFSPMLRVVLTAYRTTKLSNSIVNV